MNDILFEVLKAVLVLVVVLLARYTVPYAKSLLENSRYDWIAEWIKVAVRSAEQTVIGNKRGEEKKAIVTQFIKEQLIKKNITLTDAQLDNLIEAAVFAMNGGRQ